MVATSTPRHFTAAIGEREVLDLTETSYIDSSGISLIFDAAARMRNRRQQLRLVVAPRSFVGEVLAAVSMGDSVPIDPAVADALRAVGG